MKEYGHVFTCPTDSVPFNHFAVGLTDKNLNTGDDVPQDFKTIFYSKGASIADKFAFIGISRAQLVRGHNILLFINTNNKVKFESI